MTDSKISSPKIRSRPQGDASLHSTHGTIWAVFGHRFALEGPDGRILVDLGPEGARGLSLTPGDTVAVTGETRPTEIKAVVITLADGTRHAIARSKPPHAASRDPARGDPTAADPAAAVAAVERAGYRVDGAAARKPRHFEIPATRDGRTFDLHVTLDGAIRKAAPRDGGAPAAS